LRSQYTGQVWRDVKDSEWSASHIARHGVTMEEVRDAILYRPYWMTSGKNDSTLIYGRTRAWRHPLAVAVDDGGAAFIVTARDTTDREKRTFKRKAR
jgi:uncharacterized protein